MSYAVDCALRRHLDVLDQEQLLDEAIEREWEDAFNELARTPEFYDEWLESCDPEFHMAVARFVVAARAATYGFIDAALVENNGAALRANLTANEKAMEALKEFETHLERVMGRDRIREVAERRLMEKWT